MVSLFLVEDEYLSRESIKKNIQWQEHNIEFLGDSSDGEVALPQILEKKPDILLTDIKMPFMDGLELSQIVRSKLPATRIILISGYDEFQYARQAVSLDISEYLLKPVSSSDILCAVRKVRDQILQRQAEQQAQDLNTATQREMFFSHMYSGFLSGTRQILEHAEQLSITLSAVAYQVVIARLSPQMTYENDALVQALYDQPYALASGLNSKQIAYLLCADDKSALEKKFESLSRWSETITLRFPLSLELLPGQPVFHLTDIAESYQTINLLSALRARRKHTIDDSSLVESVPFENGVLLDFLRTGKGSTAKYFWEQYRPQITSAFSSVIYRCYLYTKLFFVINQFAKKMGISVPAELNENVVFEKFIAESYSADDFIGFGCKLCEQIIAARDLIYANRYSPAADQARAYIDQHYMDSDLSLTSVAEVVWLSPNHLSTIFKRENGISFSKYLTSQRIGQAKRLLVTTDMHPFEVGECVGYYNMNYFSMIFKKTTGMSPGQYRRENRI